MLATIMLSVVLNGGIEVQIEGNRMRMAECEKRAAQFNSADEVQRFMSAAPIVVTKLGRNIAETDSAAIKALCHAV